jgi:hypothetical protein
MDVLKKRVPGESVLREAEELIRRGAVGLDMSLPIEEQHHISGILEEGPNPTFARRKGTLFGTKRLDRAAAEDAPESREQDQPNKQRDRRGDNHTVLDARGVGHHAVSFLPVVGRGCIHLCLQNVEARVRLSIKSQHLRGVVCIDCGEEAADDRDEVPMGGKRGGHLVAIPGVAGGRCLVQGGNERGRGRVVGVTNGRAGLETVFPFQRLLGSNVVASSLQRIAGLPVLPSRGKRIVNEQGNDNAIHREPKKDGREPNRRISASAGGSAKTVDRAQLQGVGRQAPSSVRPRTITYLFRP